MAFRLGLGRLRPTAAAAAACACSLAVHKQRPAESFFARWSGQKQEPSEMYGDYVAGAQLGLGAYGVVKLATRRSSGEQFALKLVLRRSAELDSAVGRETDILRTIGAHPHIVGLVDSFELPHAFAFVLDLARGGEVFERVCEKGPYSEKDAAAIVRQVAEALRHVHSRGVCHRDIKPENLLLADSTDGARVRLCDFGCAEFLGEGGEAQLRGRWGTHGYMAPEVLRGECYSTAVDLFSVGVLLFILLGGYHPFDPTGDAPDKLVERRIKAGTWTFDETAFRHVSPEARAVVTALLAPTPEQRPSPEQLLQMPWVGGDSAPDAPLPNSHKQLRAFNDSRRAWRVAIAALDFFALIPTGDAAATAAAATVVTAANVAAADAIAATAAAAVNGTAATLTGLTAAAVTIVDTCAAEAWDAGFSEEALAELRVTFDAFDCDHSGVISSAELCQRFVELGASHAEAAAVLARVDSHHTGDISFDEFVAAVGPMMRERGRTALRRAFELFDKDHSGTIDRSELAQMLSKLGLSSDPKTVDSMIHAADGDGDGVISFDEFARMLEAMEANPAASRRKDSISAPVR